MNDFEIDLLALDLLQRADQRFERALRVAFQNDAQNFFAVGGFEQAFQRGALRHGQLVRALCLEPFVAQCFGRAL